MYRVLLADDEPIILSGLQSMLDWERLDCTVCAAARDGRQALELVEARCPDIVVCDINMPRLTGLELLETCAQRYPELVFIMLTNHQDFHMAQQSLRNRAVDYLLKIDLDEEKLARSLRLAIDECEKRRRLLAPSLSRREGSLAEEPARHAAVLLSPEGGYGAQQALAALEELGAGSRCAAALLILDPSAIPDIGSFTREERQRLFRFHLNLAQDVAQKVFQGAGFTLLPSQPGCGTAVFFLWGLEDAAPIAQFQARLTAAFRDISQMGLSVLATGVVSGQGLAELRLQTEVLKREHALSPKPFLSWSQSMGKTDYVSAAKRYVDSHILERVLVQEAAAAIGITPNYLSSLFKRQLGQNFMDYVNATKVKYACALLQDGKHMVYEVSHMLGYDNAYYFTKVFKRYMKMTPTEYQAASAPPP